MDALKHYARFAFVLAILAVSVAGLYNVFGDAADLVPMAKKEACPSGLCGMTRLDRTPFAQTFTFATPKGETIEVSCRRAAVFFGEYGCAKR